MTRDVSVKYCKGCDATLPADSFYKQKGVPRGHYCKICLQSKSRENWKNGYREKMKKTREAYALNNRDKLIQFGRNYYNTEIGRAKSMMKTIKKRMGKWGILDSLDFEESYLIDLMKTGFCVETGIEFIYEKQERFKCHPFSPSVDRIDSTKGYTKDNIRMVIWQYNLMKGEMTDEELLNVCKRIIERSMHSDP